MASIIYTSGTTGPPKGVMLAHHNVVWAVESQRTHWGKHFTGKRVISYLPHAHVAERMNSHWCPAVAGFEVTSCPEVPRLAEYVLAVRPQLLFCPPRLWEKLYEQLRATAAPDGGSEELDRAVAVGREIRDARRRGEEPPPAVTTSWQALEPEVSRWKSALGLDAVELAYTAAAAVNPWSSTRSALGTPLSDGYGMSENCTVNRPGEADGVVAEATSALGSLDGLAVTTGTTRAGHQGLDAPDDAWAETFDDVVMGTVRTVRAALPHHVASGRGTVVTTSAYSIHAFHPERAPYVAMKSAIAAFTKTVAKAYGPRGVRANCVCPGVVETESLARLRRALAAERNCSPEGLLEAVMRQEWHMDVALGRPGRPEEVGELYAFLLSARAGYLTGAVINIDGGTDF